MFNVNVGSTDRMIRIVTGIVLLALFFVIEMGAWGWLVALVGVVLLATGLMSRCALYSLLGIDTRGNKAT
ncbi:YgaP family membrane protein [Roseitalea porphyridii]|uniref:DUF2892 domain-containing protein n=1 Tax=Roseitalea porphyridii TaxID=1852022 RepID=A0A4P6V2G6_9HYPH|nr:DUF2892 domain-containing protein [Roseitalea porphyridii]QBK31581.1 DUF2892 domain-containing protein [Roseitalea porphyridii]